MFVRNDDYSVFCNTISVYKGKSNILALLITHNIFLLRSKMIKEYSLLKNIDIFDYFSIF